LSENLLDTNVVLIALQSPSLLSTASREAVISGPSVVSIVCYWEVVLKSMKGKLDVGDPRIWWEGALELLAARVLPIRPDHIGKIYTLPFLHNDPFDRLLIAQALTEEMTLISREREFADYKTLGLKLIC
jgi:PIN domain nuclease of toxin-antitoxin system